MQYDGSKNGSGVYQTIINLIPPHKIYIEPFLGSGAVMRFKLPAEVNIGIEKDEAVIRKFWSRPIAPYIILKDDAISWLSYNPVAPGTFIYLDPPYPISSRRSGNKIYRKELTDNDHRELLQIIRGLKCNVLISTYENPIYKEYLKDWHLVKYKAVTQKGTATEFLYMNYSPPEVLHDYSFVGSNFTQRQRIKRKISRHIERLERLPAHERNAILTAILKNNPL